VQVPVTPPTLPDGVNAEQFRLRFEVVDTSGTTPVAFANVGNQPLDNPVIVNKILSTKLGLEHFYEYTSMPVGRWHDQHGQRGQWQLAPQHDASQRARPRSEHRCRPYLQRLGGALGIAGRQQLVAVSDEPDPVRQAAGHPDDGGEQRARRRYKESRWTSIPPMPTPLAGRSNKFIEFEDATGTLQHFDGVTGSDGITFWQEPPGVHLYLRAVTTDSTNPKFWAITRPDRTTFYFNSAGYPHIRHRQERQHNLIHVDRRPAWGRPRRPQVPHHHSHGCCGPGQQSSSQ